MHKPSVSARLLAVLLGLIAAVCTPLLVAAPAQAATYTISGTITGPNAAGTIVNVPDVYVTAYNGNETEVGSGYASSGSYSFTVTTPGPIRLQARCAVSAACEDNWGDIWFDRKYTFEEATPISFGTATTFTANIRMDRLVTVTGKLVDKSGQPITGGVEVEARPWGGGTVPGPATPDANGNYSIPKVQTGPTSISVRDTSGNHIYADQTLGSTESPYYVRIPNTSPTYTANFTVQPANGFLATVTNSSGQRLPRIYYSVSWRKTGTADAWEYPQYGPLSTDDNGQVWWAMKPGYSYRFCLSDTDYSPGYNPAVRYAGYCWKDATTEATATKIVSTATSGKQLLPITMTVAGNSLRITEPYITDVPKVGQTLTVDAGTWSPSTATLRYLWGYWDATTRKFVGITGATGKTFVVPSSMDGKSVGVRVTGSGTGYVTVVRYDGIGKIGGTIPTRTAPLTLSGTALVGRTLSIGYGTTSPAISSSGHTISWLVGGVEIPDNQDRTLVLTSSMIGKQITARVISYNWSCCENQIQESLTSATVQGVLTTGTPTISGTATVGSTLTAAPGTWGPAPVTLTYRWFRGTTAIAGATASTYKVTTADQGNQLKVRVTGTKTNYKTAWKDSALSAVVP